MTNKIIVFSGPSLAGVDLEGMNKFEFRPPCKQGDIFLATRDNPDVIAIIDGYFEGQPSVWHKEILYALSEGIYVFGASSMGALRAAETHTFGMQGVGAIFEAYRDGYINDDDEVGLVHGPEELDYIPLNEPMVNVRATCSLAVEHKELSAELAESVSEIAKEIFYKSRTWDSVLDQLEAKNPQDLNLSQFTSWLSEHALDQKKIDALELLEVLDEADFSKPFDPNFEFTVTEFWHRCKASWGAKKTTKNQNVAEGHDGGFRLLG